MANLRAANGRRTVPRRQGAAKEGFESCPSRACHRVGVMPDPKSCPTHPEGARARSCAESPSHSPTGPPREGAAPRMGCPPPPPLRLNVRVWAGGKRKSEGALSQNGQDNNRNFL